jgi:hypothetical protein
MERHVGEPVSRRPPSADTGGAADREARLRTGLALLLDALQTARALGHDPWQFAVELADLRSAGLTGTDLRLLVCQGYVAQAVERTAANDPQRRFEAAGEMALDPRSGFVLTEAGLALAGGAAAVGRPAGAPPYWDTERRELWFRGRLVKRFRGKGGCQEKVLAAFEEEHWCPRIDNPLPGGDEEAARLHDAIKRLNRHQVHRLLRFRGDGTAEGVIWEETAGL